MSLIAKADVVLAWSRLPESVEQEHDPVDVLSLAGVGAEVWQAVDVDEYLEEERASWEN